MKIVWSAMMALIVAGSIAVPQPAAAQSTAEEFAESQCGDNRWWDIGFNSYENCYASAIDFWWNNRPEPGGTGASGGSGGPWYRAYIDGCSARSRLCGGGESGPNDP